MYSYNPDRRGLSEVKLLALEPWRLYPAGDALVPDFLLGCPRPALRIDRATPIASIGSCFAREIKVWLQAHGFNFVETATGPCTAAGSARYDRVYNTFTIVQEFERAFGRFEPAERLWRFRDEKRERLLDPYRKNVAWDDLAEMERELAEHRENVQRAFAEARVVIVTVGQSEIWYDRRDGAVYPLVPPVQVYDPEIHGFRLTTYEENLANLERVHALLKRGNPDATLLMTVSPVPLRATFQRMDAVTANTAGKSMLRAAVDAFVRAHPDDVVYFPAYEIVTVLEREPFESDARHVRPETIDRIMRVFEAWFVADAP